MRTDKYRGTIVLREAFYAHCVDELGLRYMIVPSSMTWREDFDKLAIGGAVKFTPIEGPRGNRAIEVEVVNA